VCACVRACDFPYNILCTSFGRTVLYVCIECCIDIMLRALMSA